MSTLALSVDRRAIGAEELAVGLRILADLLDAGLPLTRVLQAFGGVAPDAWRAITPELTRGVREGRGLARSLEESPLLLPPIVLGLIRAGEAGAGLAPAMRRAAEHAEGVAATRAAIRSALAYPALVAVVGTAAIGVLLGVVLPRFGAVLAELGQQLPPMTRLVLAAAEALRRGGPAALGVLGGGVFLLHAWRQRPEGRRAVDRFLLGVPAVGEVRWASASARLAASLAALLECGIPLRAALRHARVTVADAEIEARLEAARERLEAGDPLGRTFEALEVVTPMAARLVAAGEEGGRLPGMLAFAARLEQSRAERLTRTAVRLVEPTLILVFAGIVGVVAAAMLQAIYAVRPA